MIDREKVIKGLEICSEHGSWHGLDCELNEAYKDCPYRGCETGCIVTIAKDAIALLKEQQTEYVDMGFDIDNDGRVTHRWDCKSCEYEIYGKSIIGLKYCPNCGKAVKWE